MQIVWRIKWSLSAWDDGRQPHLRRKSQTRAVRRQIECPVMLENSLAREYLSCSGVPTHLVSVGSGLRVIESPKLPRQAP